MESLPLGSTSVGVIAYTPTGLLGVAVVAQVAVMLSPFWTPVRVPPNTGFGCPYTRAALLTVSVSGAGTTTSVFVKLTAV